MDIKTKARITSDTYEGKIQVQPEPRRKLKIPKRLICGRTVTLKPMEESKVIGECSLSLEFALVENIGTLELHLMDGLVLGRKEEDIYRCNVVMINLGREGAEIGNISEVNESDFAPIQEV